MADNLTSCLAVIASLCVDGTVAPEQTNSVTWSGATLSLHNTTVTSMLNSDAEVLPYIVDMRRVCRNGKCLFYRGHCGDSEAQFTCTLWYSYGWADPLRKVEVTGARANVSLAINHLSLVRAPDFVAPLSGFRYDARDALPPTCYVGDPCSPTDREARLRGASVGEPVRVIPDGQETHLASSANEATAPLSGAASSRANEPSGVANEPMTYESCAMSRICTVRGMVTAEPAAHAVMGRLQLPDGRCVSVSLPREQIVNLRRDGPREMTVTGRVYGEPAERQEVLLEIQGRNIGLGLCDDFFVFVPDRQLSAAQRVGR